MGKDEIVVGRFVIGLCFLMLDGDATSEKCSELSTIFSSLYDWRTNSTASVPEAAETVSMCCNFSVTCMRYSIIRAQKYSKVLEKTRKDHSLTFVIKMILLVHSYMFNYQIFERFIRVTVLLINDHKKSDKSLAGSCHTHEFVLLGNVFIAMEGNARFDVLEGCSAHHFVKLPPAIFWRNDQKATVEIL